MNAIDILEAVDARVLVWGIQTIVLVERSISLNYRTNFLTRKPSLKIQLELVMSYALNIAICLIATEREWVGGRFVH